MDLMLSRAAAILAAAVSCGPGADRADVEATARAWNMYITGARLTIRTDTRTYRQGNYPGLSRHTTTSERGAVQLHDDEQVRISIDPEDAKGFDVPATDSAFTPADPAVVTAQRADDGLSALMVAGQPGSTVVDITVGPAHVTWAVDVVPGDVATIKIVEGTPEKQPGF